MVTHPVAATVVLLLFVAGGLFMAPQIRQEIFPDHDLPLIRVDASYPGASPHDVEQAVLLPMEDAIQDVPGVERIRSFANEGSARVEVSLVRGVSGEHTVNEIMSAIDSIAVLPEAVERPSVSLRSARSEVVTVLVHAATDERTLHEIAEEVRAHLLEEDHISRVAISGVRVPEISIEIGSQQARTLGLSLPEIASIIRAANVDMPSGGLQTPGREVLVRTTERRERREEFEDIILMASPDGSMTRLGDVATVTDGFRDNNRLTYFNDRLTARLIVSRVGDQTPLEVSAAARRAVEELSPSLPPGVELTLWDDASAEYRERIGILLRNAWTGLLLVLVILGLFLRVRLALRVTLGIPVAFCGALLAMPLLGLSFNMISLFAFILALGILVDYAIVVGEAIHTHREEGKPQMEASIAGVREVAGPLAISLATTSLAFAPLVALPGSTGLLYRMIPVVVIVLLAAALVVALLTLPAQLASDPPPGPVHRFPGPLQARLAGGLERFTNQRFLPTLQRALRLRYVVLASGVALMLVVAGLIASDRLTWSFMPEVEGDIVRVDIRMPFGTDADVTRDVALRARDALSVALLSVQDDPNVPRDLLIELGRAADESAPLGSGVGARSHVARVSVMLGPSDQRGFSSSHLSEAWREAMGQVPGAESLRFSASRELSSGRPIAVQLRHNRPDQLELAAVRLSAALAEVEGVVDVDHGLGRGKEQLDVRLRPEARSFGMTETLLANQLRAAFFGVEASRIQRGRNEVRAFVRLPAHERRSEAAVERMILRSPRGGELPLPEVATVVRTQGPVTIERENGARVAMVSASLREEAAANREVASLLERSLLPSLAQEFPGLSWSAAGQERELGQVAADLRRAVFLALALIFLLLALSFRSWLQPAAVLLVVPFACIGAIAGHVLLGVTLTFLSLMGMIALGGIIVNASLLLLSSTRDHLHAGESYEQAVLLGAARRLRPIVLTALTTFAGLLPMILESSPEAAFLTPMAVSLGFGILFGTVLCLILVPCMLMAMEDLRRWWVHGATAVATAPLEPSRETP